MMLNRPRRNRQNEVIRSMVRETSLSPDNFIAPLFVIDGKNQNIPIKSMPGQSRLSIDELVKEVKELYSLGVKCVALFPAIDEKLKTPDAREAYNRDGLNFRSIRAVKEAVPGMLVMGDIALDPYSSDGHDGLVDPKTGEIMNDPTLEVLAKQALCEAEAGADIIGPSDMMDGRVGYIRMALDESSHQNKLIMSYTAKYASSFYGPFRDALDSAPKKGDKKTYQMDPANSTEALREAELDIAEGADILMVKPGLPYLDIIYRLKEMSTLPIAAYNISGEYAMLKAAAQNGWLDNDKAILETLTCFRRAGADIVLTYFAKEAARLLNK
ncbi:porphobilinogen synthase [Peredibacter starrii]|uniref:Delta-aminolevulinic acid dehydratase n=1 Tax=Peredibacter starrii TaxID=28202 RepID=A0AAX4HK72_9BACT|nr:porphobilinogen synthase [Peredibacter starrii]WPU63651.1 porphobilinogen synthase [Peredibacter starrii]